MPQGLYDIDVAATFGVSLRTVGDFYMLIKDTKAGKHDELLSKMTNDDHLETMDALGTICNLIQANNTNVEIPCKSVDINTKSTSYAGAAGVSVKDQPKVDSNFRSLVADPIFDGVNISIPRKVVKKVKHRLERIMMNSKGFFFFKFDSWAGLESILEGGPWLIRKSSIILRKWSMDTRLLKKELSCIPIWVKLHDVPIQVFKEADLVDAITISIPLLIGDGFTIETIRVEYEWRSPKGDICKIFGHVHDHCSKKVTSTPIVTTSNVVTPIVEKSNDGFQTVGKKKRRKGKSKSTNGGQFVGPLVKHNVRYEPKATTSEPKKGTTNLGTASKSSSMLKSTYTSSKNGNINTYNS
nr:hypothetical protein [Tanacetum cinerariifolium]